MYLGIYDYYVLIVLRYAFRLLVCFGLLNCSLVFL